MNVAVDTHALAWYIDGDSRLSPAARGILSSNEHLLLIPAMVIVELMFLWQRKHSSYNWKRELDQLRAVRTLMIIPLDEAVLGYIPPTLDIHDAVIVASAIAYSRRLGETVTVLTKDERITASGLVATIW
jgi:predicted nucleic acid-binding protein